MDEVTGPERDRIIRALKEMVGDNTLAEMLPTSTETVNDTASMGKWFEPLASLVEERGNPVLAQRQRRAWTAFAEAMTRAEQMTFPTETAAAEETAAINELKAAFDQVVGEACQYLSRQDEEQ